MFRRLLIIAITLTSLAIGCDETEDVTFIAGTLTATFEGAEHHLDTGNNGSTYVSSSDPGAWWFASCWHRDGNLSMTLGNRLDAGTTLADVLVEAQDRSGTFDSTWYFQLDGKAFAKIACVAMVYQEQVDPFQGYIALADCDLGQNMGNGSAEESPMRIDRGLFHLRCK